jgi:tetratricopeptide (TPR) repeat protein
MTQAVTSPAPHRLLPPNAPRRPFHRTARRCDSSNGTHIAFAACYWKRVRGGMGPYPNYLFVKILLGIMKKHSLIIEFIKGFISLLVLSIIIYLSFMLIGVTIIGFFSSSAKEVLDYIFFNYSLLIFLLIVIIAIILGYLGARAIRDHFDIIEAANKRLSDNPNDIEALLTKANELSKGIDGGIYEMDEAITSYEQVIRLDPNNEVALQGLEKMEEKKKKKINEELKKK